MKLSAITAVRQSVVHVSSGLGHRILSNAGWELAGALLGRGLHVLGMMAVARILGRDQFGALTMIYSTVLMFETFAILGLRITTTKFVAACRVQDPERAGRIISLCSYLAIASGTVIAIAVSVAAPYLAENAIAAPNLVEEIRFGALLLFFSAWTATQASALVGFEAFKLLALTRAVSGIAIFFALIVGAKIADVQGALIALVLGSILTGLINHLAVRQAAKRSGVVLRHSFSFSELSILWRFSLPALIMGVMWMPTNWATNAMLVNIDGGYGQLGLLGVALQWFALLLFLPGILTQAVLPVITERIGSGAPNDAIKITSVIALLIFISMIVVAACISFVSPWIMTFYGDAYQEGAMVLVAIAIAAAAAAPQTQFSNYFAAKDRMWLNAALNMLWAIVMLVGAFFLVEKGAIGVAAAMIFAYLVRTLVSFGAFWVVSQDRLVQ